MPHWLSTFRLFTIVKSNHLLTVVLATSFCACTATTFQPITRDPSLLSGTEIQRRIDFIDRSLEGSRLHAQLWHYGWLFVDTVPGIALTTALAATADSKGERVAGIVGAGQSLMGVAYLYLDPLEARYGAEPLRPMPDATREDLVYKLEQGEIILQKNAERANQRWSWTMHLGNAFVAAAGAGIILGTTGDGKQAAISGAASVAGGEAQFWTAPAKPAEDLEDYKRFVVGMPETSGVDLSVVPAAAGLGVRLTF